MSGHDAEAQPPETTRQALTSDVHADVIFRSSKTPPEVTLSFQALAEPVQLWRELTEIGWTVPPCPPRPSSAIEWVPDPVAGTDYTVHPWRVKEFRLGEGAWLAELSDQVGVATIRTLRRHGAEIFGVPERIESLILEAEAAPVPVVVTEPVEPLPATEQVIFIDMADVSLAEGQIGLSHWMGVTGRSKVESAWSELDAERAHRTDLEAMTAASAQTWLVEGTIPSGSGIALRMIVPGIATNDKKLAKVTELLGGAVTTLAMRPLSIGTEPAVLVCTHVQPSNYVMLESSFRLRFPNAILRVEH